MNLAIDRGGIYVLKSAMKKDDKSWQKISVRVAIWRKLRLLAAERDTTLGELVAELVEKEEAGSNVEREPAE